MVTLFFLSMYHSNTKSQRVQKGAKKDGGDTTKKQQTDGAKEKREGDNGNMRDVARIGEKERSKRLKEKQKEQTKRKNEIIRE